MERTPASLPPNGNGPSSDAKTASSVSGELLTKILNTYDDSKTSHVNLNRIVELIEDIFLYADGSFKATQGILDDTASLDNYDGMTQALEDIHDISCELSCNHSGDLENMAIKLMEGLKVKGYKWSAKVVLVVAAFALTFGEFWLLSRLRKDDPFARSLDLLRGYSHITDFKELNKFLKALMDVVKTNFAFLEKPVCDMSIQKDSMKDAMEFFPTATYQIIHSVVELSSILGKKVDYDIGQTISRLEAAVSNINVTLQAKLKLCKTDADEHEEQQYQAVCEIVQSKEHIKIIAKFTGKDEGEVSGLRGKHVLFFISDLEISIEAINIVKRFDRNSRAYEIIWLPIVDRQNYEANKFTDLEANMTWTVGDPCKIEPSVVRYIKTQWYFIKYPIAVSLKENGEVTGLNVLPMLLTWGNSAHPFDIGKEEQLWGAIDEKTGWKLDFLITEEIDGTIKSWGKKTKEFVCLFGSENATWIQDFTAEVKKVTVDASVSVNMAYVGRNKGKGLANDKLIGSDILAIKSEYRLLFWSRLESIFYSKIQLNKNSKTDGIMREVMKVLDYDGKDEGWAIFAMGSQVMVTTEGKTALTIMKNYSQWEKEAAKSSFLQGIKTYLSTIRLPHSCIRIDRPVLGRVPGKVFCPDCSKPMEMSYSYRCCG